jgi:hypothetical protein
MPSKPQPKMLERKQIPQVLPIPLASADRRPENIRVLPVIVVELEVAKHRAAYTLRTVILAGGGLFG